MYWRYHHVLQILRIHGRLPMDTKVLPHTERQRWTRTRHRLCTWRSDCVRRVGVPCTRPARCVHRCFPVVCSRYRWQHQSPRTGNCRVWAAKHRNVNMCLRKIKVWEEYLNQTERRQRTHCGDSKVHPHYILWWVRKIQYKIIPAIQAVKPKERSSGCTKGWKFVFSLDELLSEGSNILWCAVTILKKHMQTFTMSLKIYCLNSQRMKCTAVFSILGCCLVSVSNLLTTFRDSVFVPFLSFKMSKKFRRLDP